MRVAHVLEELNPSGAETMLAVAGPLWPEFGVDSVIISKCAVPGPYSQRLRESGYSVRYIDPQPEWSFPIRLRRLLNGLDADVLHVHTEHANFWIAAAGRAAGIKRIVRTVHNVFEFGGALRVERLWQRRLLRMMGATTVAVSVSVADNELKRFNNPARLIPNWYDPQRFKPVSTHRRTKARHHFSIPSDALVVSTVGNCGPVKRHNLVVEALRELPSNVVYLHLGQQQPGEPERALSTELGVAGRSRFLPPNEDSATVLEATDVFVMPSEREGASIAALEAVACGVRCVFADAPGLWDWKESEAHIMWTPSDGSGLAASIMAAAAMPPPSADTMQQIRERYAVERGIRCYCTLYGIPPAPCHLRNRTRAW